VRAIRMRVRVHEAYGLREQQTQREQRGEGGAAMAGCQLVREGAHRICGRVLKPDVSAN